LQYRGELQVDSAGFLDSAHAEPLLEIPTLLPVVQLLHSSADPGQITSNCLFHNYVSHILVKSNKNYIIAKTLSQILKPEQ
jgi:hypothetical protein